MALLGSLAVAALSLLVLAPAPSYDAWSWLLWGREIAGGGLSTADGPAFKPLPVAVCALLAPLGSAAPLTWVLVGRVGAVLAVWLAFGLGRRLAGGSVTAGVLAAVGVVLCGGYVSYAAEGLIAGWLLALALAGLAAWRAGRPRLALACGVGCGLLQVESWPFLLALGIVLWRRRPGDRPLLAACAVAVPALWLVPELIGSGDLLRSADRARVPNPGQPALADVPALASLTEAAGLLLWPLWLGIAALVAVQGGRRSARAIVLSPALAPALAGLAWIGIVATMAQVGGFSGEPRYALPGVALIAVSGAAGLASQRLAAGALVAAVGLVALASAPRLDDVAELRAAQAHQQRLAHDLGDAVEAAGGRDAVLRCGRPHVGRLRGPLLAYRLEVEKRAVEADRAPSGAAVVFRSRLRPEAPVTPAAPAGFREIARTRHWRVATAC